MKMKNQKRSVIRFKNQKGQAVVEYVIIIVVVALAALLVLTAFSDRLRGMIAGVTNTLGGEAAARREGRSLPRRAELHLHPAQGPEVV